METIKNIKKDDFGDRMKGYENITRTYLLPRSYTFCRIDGRAFHTYLKKCQKPFDKGVMSDMDATAIYLCENVQNTKLAYVQSDEITLLLCDFESITTDQFFDGNIQKICSVVASMATAKFNELRRDRQVQHALENDIELSISDRVPLAMFDCRCWNVPSRMEACNAFIWRNQDCSRNSLSMVAQSHFSHKELHAKNSLQKHEMLHSKGINWATDFTNGEKNGRLIVNEEYTFKNRIDDSDILRTRWVSKGAWKFTEDKHKLLAMIPKYE